MTGERLAVALDTPSQTGPAQAHWPEDEQDSTEEYIMIMEPSDQCVSWHTESKDYGEESDGHQAAQKEEQHPLEEGAAGGPAHATEEPQLVGRSQQALIKSSLDEFDHLTCIKFVYRRHESQYIKIISEQGCWSNIGYTRHIQFVSLERHGCVQPGVIQHELLHSIGFNHEQSRSDRDYYVTIIKENILKGAWFNFVKLDTNNLGTPYDYSSVMHYGKFAFSKDHRSATIVPKPNPNINIGQRFGMSTLDILKINKLYNCSKCKTCTHFERIS
ncbi:hatching enzyme 1.2-like [Cetorhinus maximus]